MLYPKKNLIPPFNDAKWFPNGAVSIDVDPKDPYKASITIKQTSGVAAYFYQVPVEIGKTYTFSFGKLNSLYRIYKTQVSAHDPNTVLISDSTAGKPDTFTFTADSSYKGYITLRLTHSVLGTFDYENLQLEEGTKATPFEPYKLVNKPAILPKDIVAPNITGSGHNPTNGNVFTILKDVKMKTSQIYVSTTGVFSVAVYEWEEGKGIVGNPLFQKDVTLTTTGIQTFDFGGVPLKAGKKYFIGRSSNVNQAALMRAMSYDVGKLKYVKWEGGTDYNGTTVAYPTTYYYFFSLVLERPEQDAAVVYPKKNLFHYRMNESSSSYTTVKVDGSKITVDNKEAGPYRYLSSYPIDLKPNTNYTLSLEGKKLKGDAIALPLAYVRKGSDRTALVALNGVDKKYVNFNTGNEKSVLIYFYASTSTEEPTTCEYDKIMLVEGSDPQPFEPYKLVNKTATLYPERNLIKPFGDKDYYYRPLSESNFTVVSPRRLELNATADHQYMRFPIKVKRNTVYTVAAKHNGKMGIYTSDGASGIVDYTTNQQATFNSGNRDEIRFYWTNIGMGNGKFFIEDLIISEGTNATFEPYKEVNKPAVLYPQKNLIKGFSSYISNGITMIDKFNEYKAQMRSTNPTSNGYWEMDVEPYTDYVYSMIRPNDVSIGIFNADASKNIAGYTVIDDVVFNSGDNKKVRAYVRSVNVTAGAIFVLENPQLEKGKVKTTFEPYKIGNKPL
jgi:hypothetical protein